MPIYDFPFLLPIETRVKQGLVYLDEHKPDWINRIDLDALDLSDGNYCVLGQLEGSYEVALRQHGEMSDSDPFDQPTLQRLSDWALDHGFLGHHSEYLTLTNTWRQMIEERLHDS